MRASWSVHVNGCQLHNDMRDAGWVWHGRQAASQALVGGMTRLETDVTPDALAISRAA
jgi:hypothetical protein